MLPPIAQVLSASAGIKAVFGSAPIRAYPAGKAPESPTRPYLVFQTIAANPENSLGDTPDADASNTQFDVYGDTVEQARGGTYAVEAAFQFPVGEVQAVRELGVDPDTNLIRVLLEVALIDPRT